MRIFRPANNLHSGQFTAGSTDGPDFSVEVLYHRFHMGVSSASFDCIEVYHQKRHNYASTSFRRFNQFQLRSPIVRPDVRGKYSSWASCLSTSSGPCWWMRKWRPLRMHVLFFTCYTIALMAWCKQNELTLKVIKSILVGDTLSSFTCYKYSRQRV